MSSRPLLAPVISRLLACLLAGLLAGSLIAACSGSGARNPKYPRRRPGCDLTLYRGLPAGAWDDIGLAEVGCYLDESEIACLGRLRTEACRMGGDIIYNVPKSALRPIERGMVYRAMVAHTRDAKTHDEAPAAPESPDAGAGTIMLLPKASEPTPPPSPADAGTQ